MTLQEKVDKLVRYCRQYQSHGFMMDERRESFQNIVKRFYPVQRIVPVRPVLVMGIAPMRLMLKNCCLTPAWRQCRFDYVGMQRKLKNYIFKDRYRKNDPGIR